jgi:predicted nucleic acid-binding protein
MSRYLLDTNVCLDAALLRSNNESVLRILSASETGQIEGITAAHALDTIFYIIAQQIDRQAAYEVLEGLAQTVSIGTIDQEVFTSSLHAKWKDFEDALHHFCAVDNNCVAIITRNKRDYKASKLPVYTPEEFVTTFLTEE